MAVQTSPRPLDGPLPGGAAGAVVTVEPMVTGRIQVAKAIQASPSGEMGLVKSLWAIRGETWAVPVPAFLIHHPSAGPLLVDTGLHPSIATDPEANLGRLAASFTEPEVTKGEDVPARLRAKGIEPTALRTVVMTHLHVDHASAVSEFPGAAFIVSKAEWEDATSGLLPIVKYYRPQQFDHAFDFRTVDYEAASINSFSTFGRSFDLFGDGSVVLVSTPGHSAGHQSVVLNTGTGPFVIAGDATFLEDQLEPGADLAARARDRHNYERSIRELALYRREHPSATISPGHDPGFYDRLPTLIG
ncbi:MAG: N-acyl homoserine lactonase family protein [Solirubrobacterales bacterium]